MIAAIPTMDHKNCIQLVKALSEMEEGFDGIYVLNNSSHKLNMLEIFDNVHVINFGKNIGVNPAWNYAFKIAKDLNRHLAILNDDIVVKPYFVNKALKVIKTTSRIGLLVPATVHDMKAFNMHPFTSNKVNLSVMNKREGWCMFLHKNFVDVIEDIPESMKTFCGDDWIYLQARQNGFKCYKDNLNVIFHEVGRTMKQHPEIRQTLIHDKRIFNQYLGR